LARFKTADGDFYRAVILEAVGGPQGTEPYYVVKYVDFWEFAVVKRSWVSALKTIMIRKFREVYF
jgi:hypothetical protein